MDKAGRYGGMVTGGYVGGASAGIFGNITATLTVDAASGKPVTSGQVWDATWHGLAIDGPLSVVGATTERFLLIRFISRTSWKCPRSRR